MNASSWLKAVVFLTKKTTTKKQNQEPLAGWLQSYMWELEKTAQYMWKQTCWALGAEWEEPQGAKRRCHVLHSPRQRRRQAGPVCLWNSDLNESNGWLAHPYPTPDVQQFSVTPRLMLLWVLPGPWDPLTYSMLSLHGPSRDHNLKGWTRITSKLS